MNILVTGATGFIGSNLVDRLLDQKNEVIGVDNFDSFYNKRIKEKNIENALENNNFRFYEGDIRDEKILNKIFEENLIDVVVHLAAKAGVRPSIERPKEYYDVNVMGTLKILETMREHNVKKMIFASSSSVYGNNKKVPFSEEDNVDYPISPYAATKKACELLNHTYHHLYGFNIFNLRFFTVYGPRQRPDLAIHKFTKLISENKEIPVFGDGSSKRDYTYIDDIIDGIIRTIERVKGYEIINIGESRTISLKEMIETIEKSLGKKAMVKHLPMQPGDVNTTYANINKASKILNYNPKYSFKDGIIEFTKWFLKNEK